MSGGMEDLSRMLGKLKEETPMPLRERQDVPPPSSFRPTPSPGITARSRRSLSESPPATPPSSHHGSLIWAENKETLIFGLLISVLASALGVIGGYPYLVLFGSVAFMLFAITSFLTLVGYYFKSRRRSVLESGVGEEIERLRRKIESLEMKNPVAPQPRGAGAEGGGSRDRELERKVEELRAIVGSLSKAIGKPGDRDK